MATRDQWYKPNLLYNIHYRPPKQVEPPRLIVQTSIFNPSVCTCGEHGCEPKYRMERKVLWSEKEIQKVQQEDKTDEKLKTADGKDLKDKEYTRSDGDNGDVEHSGANDDKKQRVYKKEGRARDIDVDFQSCCDAKVGYIGDAKCGIDGDSSPCNDNDKARGHSIGCDNGKIKTEGVGRSDGDGSVRLNNEVELGDRKIKSDGVKTINAGGSVRGEDRVNLGERQINTSDYRRKDNDGGKVWVGEGTTKQDNIGNRSIYNGRFRHKSEVGIGDEKTDTDEVEKIRNYPRSARRDDKSSFEKSLTDSVGVGDKFVRNSNNIINGRDGIIDEKIIESQDNDSGCFIQDGGGGIQDERIPTDGMGSQCKDIDCVNVDGVTDGKSCMDGVASQCRDDSVFIANGDGNVETADVFMNHDVEIEEPHEEISSEFGIMSVYCNSELHSWREIQEEDNVE